MFFYVHTTSAALKVVELFEYHHSTQRDLWPIGSLHPRKNTRPWRGNLETLVCVCAEALVHCLLFLRVVSAGIAIAGSGAGGFSRSFCSLHLYTADKKQTDEMVKVTVAACLPGIKVSLALGLRISRCTHEFP